MKKVTFIPTAIQRVIIIKLVKKLLGFLAPSFQHGTKRRSQAFDLYDQIKRFERELLRCVTMKDLADHSGYMWADLQKRQLPAFLVDSLYSTLTYDPDKTDRCPTMHSPAVGPAQKRAKAITKRKVVDMDINNVQAGDTVEILKSVYSDQHVGEQFIVSKVEPLAYDSSRLDISGSVGDRYEGGLCWFSDELKIVKKKA